ncbi:hypothetical protein QTP88_015816 [Uroleucon formosanum]
MRCLAPWLREACIYLEVDQLTPDNIVGIMLKSKDSWRKVEQHPTRIIRCREVERRLQHEGKLQYATLHRRVLDIGSNSLSSPEFCFSNVVKYQFRSKKYQYTGA